MHRFHLLQFVRRTLKLFCTGITADLSYLTNVNWVGKKLQTNWCVLYRQRLYVHIECITLRSSQVWINCTSKYAARQNSCECTACKFIVWCIRVLACNTVTTLAHTYWRCMSVCAYDEFTALHGRPKSLQGDDSPTLKDTQIRQQS